MNDNFTLNSEAATQLIMPAYYIEPFVVLEAIAGGFSLVGCLFTLVIACRNFSRGYINRMIILLSIIDIVFALAAFAQLARMNSPFLCKLLSLISCAAYASSLVLTCCFAHSLFAVLNQHSQAFEIIERNWKFYMAISITVGIINGILALIYDFREIDSYSGHCVHFNKESIVANLIIDTTPALICNLYCIICYTLVVRKLKSLSQKYHMELIFYPLIIIICTLPKACKEVMVSLGAELSGEFYIVQGVLSVLQGFFNALAYGMVQNAEICKRKTVVQEDGYTSDEKSSFHSLVQ